MVRFIDRDADQHRSSFGRGILERTLGVQLATQVGRVYDERVLKRSCIRPAGHVTLAALDVVIAKTIAAMRPT